MFYVKRNARGLWTIMIMNSIRFILHLYILLGLINLRGKTSAVGDFLEAIRHIRQNCVWTNFRLQVLESSRPFYSDNEIAKVDVYISTNTRFFIVGIEELFLFAKTNFYLRC